MKLVKLFLASVILVGTIVNCGSSKPKAAPIAPVNPANCANYNNYGYPVVPNDQQFYNNVLGCNNIYNNGSVIPGSQFTNQLNGAYATQGYGQGYYNFMSSYPGYQSAYIIGPNGQYYPLSSFQNGYNQNQGREGYYLNFGDGPNGFNFSMGHYENPYCHYYGYC